jgi:hypothetical protein
VNIRIHTQSLKGYEKLTTGHSWFAECSSHSIKIENTRWSFCWVWLSTNCTSATASLPSIFLSSTRQSLAECHLVLGKEKVLSRCQVTVTEPLSSVLLDTRERLPLCRVPAGLILGNGSTSGSLWQSLCRVPARLALANGSTSGPLWRSLCRVHYEALGKYGLFAEYLRHNTRQRSFIGSQMCLLRRVLWS